MVVGSRGSLTVFEKVYYKASASSTWTLITTTGNHTITGTSTADAQYLALVGDPHGTYDYKIEVYRSGQASLDYTRDPGNDVDLNDHPEEVASEDPESSPGMTRHAVLVGDADYVGTANDLAYCDDGARDLRTALLRDPRWSAANITLLVDSAATKAAIQTAVVNMVNASDSDDLCLFFFSGHGTTGSDLSPYDELDSVDEYICPHDFNNIRDDELSNWFQGAQGAIKVALIDTCFSGGQIKVPGLRVKSINVDGPVPAQGDGFTADLMVAARDLDDLSRWVVSTACNDQELSYESDALANGVFTEYLLESMNLAAAHSNGNGELSVEEEHAYLAPRVTAYNSNQHPQLHDGNGTVQAEFVVSSLPAGTPWVTTFTAGTLRNNYSEWVGCRILVGASPLEVRSLGRVFVTGNAQNHALRLVRVSDGVVVASATWTSSGGVANQIKYVALGVPVLLAANTQYYLATQEVSGGDGWYSYNTTVTTTSAATVQTPVFSNDGTSWTPYGTAGSYSYGPVSFEYCGIGGSAWASASEFFEAAGDQASNTRAPEDTGTAVRPAEELGSPGHWESGLHPSLKGAITPEGFLFVSYLRPKAHHGSMHVIEISTHLELWEVATDAIEERVSDWDADALIERVDAVYQVPVSQAPQRFLRLRVVSSD